MGVSERIGITQNPVSLNRWRTGFWVSGLWKNR
jgi:hypothetical protein